MDVYCIDIKGAIKLLSVVVTYLHTYIDNMNKQGPN